MSDIQQDQGQIMKRPDALIEASRGHQLHDLVQLLEECHRRQHHEIAYSMLPEGLDGPGDQCRSITYGELYRAACGVAGILADITRPQDRVLLAYGTGLDFIAAFFGCLMAGTIAVPVHPVGRNNAAIRASHVAQNAGATAVLTSPTHVDRTRKVLGPFVKNCLPISIDLVDTSTRRDPSLASRVARPDAVALLQYTSGSTGRPRGVMLTHRQVLENQRLIADAFQHSANTVVGGWLPVQHDMGLIGIVLQPLYLGVPCHLMSPAGFMQRPVRWLELIARHRITTSGAPNFAYDLCAQRVTQAELDKLDLSCWQVAFCGAEPVKPQTLSRFAEQFVTTGFAESSFVPCYGLAEATLLVSAHQPGRPYRLHPSPRSNQVELVGCGDPADRAIVVDEMGQQAREGVEGEIWVRGPSLSHGYWREGSTQSHADGFGEDPSGWFKTGDFGLVSKRELFITGRASDVINIKGVKYHASDIESVIESADDLSLSTGAAVEVEIDGVRQLGVVYELPRDRRPQAEKIAVRLRELVTSRLGVSPAVIALCRIGQIPVTTSGKVRRNACRQALSERRLRLYGIWQRDISDTGPESLEPVSRIASALAGTQDHDPLVWLTEQVRSKSGGVSVVPEHDLVALGLDSLQIFDLLAKLKQRFGTQINPLTIFEGLSLGEIAQRIRETRAGPTLPVKSSDDQISADQPLTRGQMGLWTLHHSTALPVCTIARAFKIRGRAVSFAQLQKIVGVLLNRHSMLRATFSSPQGEPRCRIAAAVPPSLTRARVNDAADLLDAAANIAFTQFDLEHGPLFRVHLIEASNASALVVWAHHLVVDLRSMEILALELAELWSAELNEQADALGSAPQPLMMSDREQRLLDVAGPDALNYWTRELAGELPVTALPTDRVGPAQRTMRGGVVWKVPESTLYEKLIQRSQQWQASPYVLLMSALHVLLHQLSGQEQTLVGSPVACRADALSAHAVGYFANLIVIRSSVAERLSIRDFVNQVRSKVAAALTYQSVPFELVREHLNIRSSADKPPVFRVSLAYHASAIGSSIAQSAVHGVGGFQSGSMVLEQLDLRQPFSQFDLQFVIGSAANRLHTALEYNSDLFDGVTAQKFLSSFADLLIQILDASPETPVAELLNCNFVDRHRLVCEYNDTNVDWRWLQEHADGDRAELAARDLATASSQESLVHREIARRAYDRPDSVAVQASDVHLTYGCLHRKVVTIARRMRALGAGDERPVAVYLPRSADLIVVILAILESGSSYLPLDSDYPAARLEALVEHARPVFAVVDPELTPLRSDAAVVQIGLRDLERGGHRTADDACPDALNAAYVIFTSGSTGTPKGVVVPHEALTNRLRWMQHAYGLKMGERVLHKTPVGFDVSIWELFWPLMYGGCLVVAPPGVHRDPGAMCDLVRQEAIDVVHFVPTVLHAALQHENASLLSGLRLLICSGESLPVDLVARTLRIAPETQLENLYGPTEACVDVSSSTCRIDQKAIPIGRPIANCRMYLLNPIGHPVAPGILGEIAIGGVGLARGYLCRPDLTARSFAPDPFGKDEGARIYLTGDLGRHDPRGKIEYHGRRDGQLKINGVRVETEEVRLAILKHPGVGAAAVRICQIGMAPTLVAYVSPAHGTWNSDSLQAFLRKSLPSAFVPALFVGLDVLPVGPNGKLDAQALPPVPDRLPVSNGTQPTTPTERAIAAAWERAIGRGPIPVDVSFFGAGGDSIRVIRAIADLKSAGISVGIERLLSTATIRELAIEQDQNPTLDVAEAAPAAFQMVHPADRDMLPSDLDDAFPLSRLQEGLVFHSEHSADYEIYVTALRLQARYDPEGFRWAAGQLAARHPVLRTSFAMSGFVEPLQLVHRVVPLDFHTIDARDFAPAELKRLIDGTLRRLRKIKFDFAKPPLFRLVIIRITDQCFDLILCEPFLDGWSVTQALSDLVHLYSHRVMGARKPPPAPSSGMREFVALERKTLVSKASSAFWHDWLDVATASSLPQMSTRQTASESIFRCSSSLPADVSQALIKISTQLRVPLKSVFVAVYARTLAIFTGTRSLTGGLIAGGRPETKDADRAVGLFLNSLPLRIHIPIGQRWRDLIQDAFDAEQAMFPHRRYPMAAIQRDHGSVLFDTAFNFTHFHAYATLNGLPGIETLGTYASDQTFFPLTVQCNVDHQTGTVRIAIDYNGRRVAKPLAEGFLAGFELVAKQMAASLDKSCDAIALVPYASSVERLDDWNDTRMTWPEEASLHEPIGHWAQTRPDAIAVVDEFGGHLTYGALDAHSTAFAMTLARAGIAPGTTLGVCLQRTVRLVHVLLAVLRAGGNYLPLDPEYPSSRIQAYLRQSGVTFAVTEAATQNALPKYVTEIRADDSAATNQASSELAVKIHPSMPAYVLFTSGSTGTPNGAIISHGSAINLLRWGEREIPADHRRSVLASTSICFDLSVFELFLPLRTGATVVLVNSALSLSTCGEAARTTLVNTVPALASELLKHGPLPSNVASVILAGEPLPASLARALYESGVARVYNLYGPTEATTYATGSLVPDVADAIPVIGRPIANTQVYVLDAALNPAPAGVTAELGIGGDGIATCYVNQPALTAARFVADPFSEEPGARMYLTGDLVHTNEKGELVFIGRRDHQVKVNGHRIELAEIEAVLTSFTGVDQAIAKVQHDNTRSVLVAYVSGDRETLFGSDQMLSELRTRLPSFMIPHRIVTLPAMPLTTRGKVNRATLPPVNLERQRTPAVGPPEVHSQLTGTIVAVFSAVIGHDVAPDDNIFETGADSFDVVRIVSRLRDLLHRDFPLRTIFDKPTPQMLALKIQEMSNKECSIKDVPLVKSSAAVSSLSVAQKGLWFLDQVTGPSATYNMPVAVSAVGPLSVATLRQALHQITRRHQVLRTRIDRQNGQPRIQIVPASNDLLVVDLTALPPARVEQSAKAISFALATRPFKLANELLLRALLLRLNSNENVLAVCMHHIVADDWSVNLIVNELKWITPRYLEGLPHSLLELPVQYSDFAAWQHQMLNKTGRLSDYWRKALDGVQPTLPPTTTKRSQALLRQGGRHYFAISEELAGRARSLGKSQGATVFMVLLAALKAMFMNWTGQRDIVVGSPSSGRHLPQVSGLIGIFVNVLPIRTVIDGNPIFRKFVDQVRDVTLNAYDHQDLPFAKIIEQLPSRQRMEQSPLLQMVFGMWNKAWATFQIGDAVCSPIQVYSRTAKYDLEIQMVDDGSRVDGYLEFDSRLFSAVEATAIVKRFLSTLERVLRSPDEPIMQPISEPLTREGEPQMIRTESQEQGPDRPRRRPLQAVRGELVAIQALSERQTMPMVATPRLPLDAARWARSNLSTIESILSTTGALLLRGMSVARYEEFAAIINVICPKALSTREQTTPRTVVAQQILTSTDHPADQVIPHHNEDCYSIEWPLRILFWCVLPASKGGQTPLADSRKILKLLDSKIVQRFLDRKVLYTRCFGKGIGFKWQECFQTQDPQQVEEFCREAKIDYEWEHGREILRTKQLREAVAIHPRTKESVWFNQAHLAHVTSLPQVTRDALVATLSERDWPRHTYYGDGQPIENSVLQEIRGAFAQATVEFNWQKGDVLILDNMLVAHGRAAFEGERQIRVGMGEIIRESDLDDPRQFLS